MGTILDKIASVRLERLAEQKGLIGIDRLEERAGRRPDAHDFYALFAAPGIHVIAEVKRASPSLGVIKADLDPQELAGMYQAGGAAAISVLTEQDHFQGDFETLEKVRKCVSLPILCKDFITDPYQVVEARASGADSFLLIAALLATRELRTLIHAGREWKMEPLVEVHDSLELGRALEAGARIIGINNRDLKTFRVDLSTSLRLLPGIPEDRIVISESGIKSHEEVMSLAQAGVKGFLVGETLVRAADPATKLRSLIHGI